MIVPSMTLEEVASQFQGDYSDLLAKRKTFQPKFSSLVKRSTRFPVRVKKLHSRECGFYEPARGFSVPSKNFTRKEPKY